MAPEDQKPAGIVRPARRIPDSDLLNFTTAVHAAFPREVRDMVYKHLFDPQTTRSISLSGQPSLDDYPIYYSTKFPSDWPRFLQPTLVPESCAKEVIAAFYEAYKDFSVANPSEIGNLLKQDFFKMGVVPKDGILSAFEVCGCLDARTPDTITVSKLAEQFAPLLDPAQRWSKDFKLEFCLWTNLCDPYYSGGKPVLMLANKLAIVLSALKPIIKSVQGKPRKGKVAFIKVIFGGRKTLFVKAEHMDYTKEQWAERIEMFLRGRLQN